MNATWEHDAKTGTYRCGTCCAANLEPGTPCACPIPVKPERAAVAIAAPAPSIGGLPAAAEDERDLRATRARQRRNGVKMAELAKLAEASRTNAFSATTLAAVRLELDIRGDLRKQLKDEILAVDLILERSERREYRELRERERATAAAAILAQGHGAN